MFRYGYHYKAANKIKECSLPTPQYQNSGSWQFLAASVYYELQDYTESMKYALDSVKRSVESNLGVHLILEFIVKLKLNQISLASKILQRIVKIKDYGYIFLKYYYIFITTKSKKAGYAMKKWLNNEGIAPDVIACQHLYLLDLSFYYNLYKMIILT